MGKQHKIKIRRVFSVIMMMVLIPSVVPATGPNGRKDTIVLRGNGSGNEKKTPMPREVRQPYQNADEWKWVAPINGSGYCGPASLYHVIHYFKDTGVFHARGDSVKKGMAGVVDIQDITKENQCFIDHSSFGRFIQPNGMGSSWAMLKKVGMLTRTASNLEPVYSVFVCSSYTRPKDAGIRKARLQLIRDRFLKNNIPVVIHLRSWIPFCGHYVTLIGYEPDQSMVYYVDSLRNEAGIQKVSTDDFLETRFYVSGRFYKARWDGEWMAIWHSGEGVVCDQCGG